MCLEQIKKQTGYYEKVSLNYTKDSNTNNNSIALSTKHYNSDITYHQKSKRSAKQIQLNRSAN